ncbi:MAG: GGDEF domain-containing protein [Pseudomonadota bacterium]
MSVKAVFSFFVPGGLLVLAAFILFQAGLLGKWLPALARFMPYVVPVAGILLGWRFNHSRLVLALLAITLSERFLHYYAGGSGSAIGLGRMVFNVVATLLPLNIAAILMLNERGVLSLRGILRMGLICIQPLIIILFWRYGYHRPFACFEVSFFSSPILGRVPLPQPALLAFGLTFLLLLIRIKRSGAMENGFFWALVSTLFGLTLAGPGSLRAMYFSTAGLILFISVIETSHSMAFKDELTGLPSRRAMNEALLMLGSRYTVAMIDVDHFKKFNDRYGHDVGDQVLRMIAAKISGITGGGKAFRYGGEEFSILFPGKGIKQAVPHLEQIRRSVAFSGFAVRGRKRPNTKPEKPMSFANQKKKVSLTVSIGVAERKETQTNPQEVIKAADKALYRAKKGGRNRTAL